MFIKLDFGKTVPLTLGYTDPLWGGGAVLRYARENLGIVFLWEMLYVSQFRKSMYLESRTKRLMRWGTLEVDSGGLSGKQILISSCKKKAGLHTGQKSFG